MNNYSEPCFYRIDFVVIPFYTEFPWQEWVHCFFQNLDIFNYKLVLRNTPLCVWYSKKWCSKFLDSNPWEIPSNELCAWSLKLGFFMDFGSNSIWHSLEQLFSKTPFPWKNTSMANLKTSLYLIREKVKGLN